MKNIILYLMGVSFFIPYRAVKILGMNFTFTDIIVFILLIKILLNFLTKKYKKLSYSIILKCNLVYLILITCISINIMSFTIMDVYISATKELAFALLLYFMLQIIILNENINIYKYVIPGFITGGVLNCLLSISQHYFGAFYIQEATILSSKVNIYGELLENPAVGFFAHTNTNAYMVLILLFISKYYLKNKNTKIFIYIISAISVFFTQSKGGLILMIILIITKILVNNKKRLRFKFYSISILSLLQIYTLYLISLSEKFNSLGTTKDRILSQNAFFHLIYDNPIVIILGNGNGLMKEYSEKYSRYSVIYSHASFFDNILFWGVIGLFITYIVTKVYIKLIKFIKNIPENERYKALSMIASFFIILYSSFVEPLFMTQPMTYIIATWIVMSEKYIIKYNNNYAKKLSKIT